jgi:hypothetical protein
LSFFERHRGDKCIGEYVSEISAATMTVVVVMMMMMMMMRMLMMVTQRKGSG